MVDVTITFTSLDAGDIVENQFLGAGLRISSDNPNKPPMIFDTSNPTGGDQDLATDNLGNVLIISEDGDSSDPDDNAGGGTLNFDFAQPTDITSLTVLDTEEQGYIKLFDSDGRLIDSIRIPVTGNNGQSEVSINVDDVSRMEVTLCGSGAIDNIRVDTPPGVTPLCFTSGTRIHTARGQVPVESLNVGDLVLTRDKGLQPVRWVGIRTFGRAMLQTVPGFRPIRIDPGALGENIPEKELLVSRQHRVLITGVVPELLFETPEVLAAAGHLENGLTITEAEDIAEVTYVHILFDDHELVLTEGAWTESFQPGSASLAACDAEQVEELYSFFPGLRTREGQEAYSSARTSLRKFEAQLLAD